MRFIRQLCTCQTEAAPRRRTDQGKPPRSCLVRHNQCWYIMMRHKERVMSILCTHVCLQQYVCLRPHATTNFTNRCSSSNTFISLILLCTVLSEIGHPACWCQITWAIYCPPPLLPTTSLVWADVWDDMLLLICNELYINTICLVIKYTLTHYLTQNPLFLMTC